MQARLVRKPLSWLGEGDRELTEEKRGVGEAWEEKAELIERAVAKFRKRVEAAGSGVPKETVVAKEEKENEKKGQMDAGEEEKGGDGSVAMGNGGGCVRPGGCVGVWVGCCYGAVGFQGERRDRILMKTRQ